MCNLYHMSPREHVERYFRAMVPEYGAAAAGPFGNGVFLRPLDRSMEYDADRLAVVLATRSGYDPYGMVAVLQMLGQEKGDGSGADVFSTHPAPSDRMAEMEKFVPTVAGKAVAPAQADARLKQVIGKR